MATAARKRRTHHYFPRRGAQGEAPVVAEGERSAGPLLWPKPRTLSAPSASRPIPAVLLLAAVAVLVAAIAASSSHTMIMSAHALVGTAVRITRTAPVVIGRGAGRRVTTRWFGNANVPTRRFAASSGTETTTTETTAPTSSPPVVNGRLSSRGLSVDLKTIAGSLPIVLSHLRGRRASIETLEAAETIAALTSDRTKLIQDRDAQLSDRKVASAAVAQLLRRRQQQKQEQGSQQQGVDDELESAKARSNRAAARAAEAEAQLQDLEARMDDLISGIPNLLDDVVPDGDSDQDNLVVSAWGDTQALPRRLGWPHDFCPLWHDDVASQLGGYQAEEAVKLSGARFVALSGEVAQLERALAMFLMDLHTSPEHGYREVSVPLVVSRSSLEGTSQLPKFQEDLFAITRDSHTCNGEDAFLIPTAEVPVTNLHRGAVLEEADLPLSYVAHTPCFRAEAGSYGRDTKGLIRTHQFYKVELVKITTPETSDEQHELLTGHAEACLQALELPYRKVRLCSGDIGFAARHCYDLEVWLPGGGEYREISSCSNCGDFQARRMSLRYRPKPSVDSAAGGKGKAKKPKPQLCHTINGSGLAVGRTLVAVLENYQRPDGSVVVPDVLRPYMRGKEVLAAPTKTS